MQNYFCGFRKLSECVNGFVALIVSIFAILQPLLLVSALAKKMQKETSPDLYLSILVATLMTISFVKRISRPCCVLCSYLGAFASFLGQKEACIIQEKKIVIAQKNFGRSHKSNERNYCVS